MLDPPPMALPFLLYSQSWSFTGGKRRHLVLVSISTLPSCTSSLNSVVQSYTYWLTEFTAECGLDIFMTGDLDTTTKSYFCCGQFLEPMSSKSSAAQNSCWSFSQWRVLGRAPSEAILTGASGDFIVERLFAHDYITWPAIRFKLLLKICLVAPDQLIDLLLVSQENECWGCTYVEFRDQFLRNHISMWQTFVSKLLTFKEK